MRERLLADGVGATDVVPNGVPVAPLRPPLDGPPTLVFAGRLVREKGVETLLRAAAILTRELPDLRVLVAGDGPLRARCVALASESGLAGRVRWLGHLSAQALETAFAPGWVQAVPSLWEEPFWIVASKAMMRGQAVVATDSGGLGPQVEEGVSGFRVPPGDVEALTGALRKVLGDRERAERMGAAARERALRCFSADRFLDRMLALHQRMLA